MNRDFNIKTNFLRLVILLLLVIVCVGLYHGGRLAYKEIFWKSIHIDNYHDRLVAEIRRINTVITAAQKTPLDLAGILEFHDAEHTETIILLESILFNNEEIFGSAIAYEPYVYHKDTLYHSPYVYRNADTVAYTNLNDPDYDYFNKDWYLIPKTLMQPVWSEPYYDEGGGDLLMSTYSAPMFKFDGFKEKFAGIITIDVSLDWLSRSVSSIGRVMNAYAIMVSDNGTIISAPYENWVFNETIFTLAEEKKLPVLREIGRDLQRGNSGYREIEEFELLKNWMVFYAPIQASKWGLILLISQDELFKR